MNFSILPTQVCTSGVPADHGNQKRLLDLLEMELGMGEPFECWESNLGPL